MALFFSTNTDARFEVAITIDPALNTMSQSEKDEYLRTGDNSLLKINEGEAPTWFVLKAMGPKDRENAEVSAGAYSRSELGRLLWIEEPKDYKEKAYWRENLTDIEKKALSSYELYINRVYEEMVKGSVIEVKGSGDKPWDLLQSIRPDAYRVKAVSELIFHIQRLSLLSDEGK